MASGLSNRLIYAMLGLLVLVIIGMLVGSWRIVLYPFLLIVGISISFGLTRALRSNQGVLLIPVGVVALLLALYGSLDLMSVADPAGEGMVFGFAPTTALYFFGITPVILLVGLAFALTFSRDAPELEGGGGAGVRAEEDRVGDDGRAGESR